MANANSTTATHNNLESALNSAMDEMHNLDALVGAAKQAAWEFTTGDRDINLIDRIDRLMLMANTSIKAAMEAIDKAGAYGR